MSSPAPTIDQAHLDTLIERFQYSPEVRATIEREHLLPLGLIQRLHAQYPQHSGLGEIRPFMFNDKARYSGKKGFREALGILAEHGIELPSIPERELFIDVYRFMVTRHVLNSIDWDNYATDSLFQLTFPQPEMIRGPVVDAYKQARSEDERQALVAAYMDKTNPHDGNQKLNRPWFVDENGQLVFLDGSQHKYPQCQLIFDETTQNCMSFCTYCFRHAQVRGDVDMFLQQEIGPVHDYLREHPEVTDLLITGGDAGYIPSERLEAYVGPILSDPALRHIRTIRLGTRSLTFQPEMILSPRFDPMLELFDRIDEAGVQLAWMSHFSTPRELLNPSTIAAIRRLRRHGVYLRSQSPMMNHISLFTHADGSVDVDRSAQNWIDLGNLLATMRIGFHSMYCARPTGEHHYFTAPLADMNRIASKVHRSLASINRPARYISMTSSAGKISVLGECMVGGQRAFALKFTEGRNMEWLDQVFLARFDEQQHTVDLLEPFDTPEFFFRGELREIEQELASALAKART